MSSKKKAKSVSSKKKTKTKTSTKKSATKPQEPVMEKAFGDPNPVFKSSSDFQPSEDSLWNTITNSFKNLFYK